MVVKVITCVTAHNRVRPVVVRKNGELHVTQNDAI
jgi:hypothetical protein